MKIIFIVRQSLDIFWIVEYNFNGNQDKRSHRYSEGRAFILKSIDPLHSDVTSQYKGIDVFRKLRSMLAVKRVVM